jgi:hypothetical protein
MDEFDLVRSAVDDPKADTLARERVRQRLRQAVAVQADGGGDGRRDRSGRRARVWWIPAAAAVIALILLTVQAVLPSGSGGPRESAASELARLSAIAAAQGPLPLRPGSYLYSKEAFDGVHEVSYLGGGGSFDLILRQELQTWVAPDGSGRRLTLTQGVEFASPADRAAWQADGFPGLPKAGTLSEDRYGSGEAPLFDLSSLPTDPDRLLAAIRAGTVIAAPRGDRALLSTVGTLLAQANASPALRGALFKVAAGIASVTLEQRVKDPTGRPGIGVAMTSEGSTTELIIDPASSQLLALSLRLAGSPVGWRIFLERGVVTSQTAHPRQRR